MPEKNKFNRLMKQEIEMLEALFNHAAEGIIISGKDGKINMLNPKAEKQFGYEKDELIGKNIDVLVSKRLAAGHEKKRKSYTKSPHPREMGKGLELYARRKDNSEFPVEISLSTFSTSEGTYVMSFVIDITERKKKDAELTKVNEEIKQLNIDLEKRVEERTKDLEIANEELAQSKHDIMNMLEKEQNLNELKSRFITTASHEFRTPLATILSSVSLISKYELTAENDKRKKHINRIKFSVHNLTEILNDFLSLGKLEEGVVRNNPVHFRLDEFAKDLTEELKSTAKPDQKIEYIPKKEGAIVKVDKQLLKNVLINLLSNAIKYSPEGKRIDFKTTALNGELKIEIIDQGIGIPDEDQPHLFQRFFRAKNSVNIEGTGLGLNIVKKYIELMSGKITLQSTLYKGTTVIVTLPNKI